MQNPRIKIIHFGAPGWIAVALATVAILAMGFLALGLFVILLPVLLLAPLLYPLLPRAKPRPIKRDAPGGDILEGDFRVVEDPEKSRSQIQSEDP